MPYNTYQEVYTAILGQVVKSIQRTGNDIFDLSQNYVPVKTGRLKNSGAIANIVNGVKIEYTAPYARIVEIGAPGQGITGTQVVSVPSYYRKGKLVKGHTRTLVNQIIIEVAPGEFRTVSTLKARKGQFFLKNATVEAMPNLVKHMTTTLQEIENH